MAFEGDLSQLSLGDVLQTIAMSRQVGTFILRGKEERHLGCGPKGVALVSTSNSLGLRIGTVLVGSGKIKESQLEAALKLQSRRRQLKLGEVLIGLGACTEDDVRAARRYLAAEEIFELFLWTEGKFEFQGGEPDASGPFADLWFDVSSLAMEAARRVDEFPRLLAVVPEDEVLIAARALGQDRDAVLSNRDLARLFELVDAGRTVSDIEELYHRGRFDTIKGLHTLIESGIVRPATVDEVVASAAAATNAGDNVRAARLYRRALRHEPGDDAVHHALAESLAASGEKKEAAAELVRIGAGRLAAGKGLPAVESLRNALKLDAASATAHEGLSQALAECGRVDEAADAALTGARLRITDCDYDGACRMAAAGLAHRPGDAALLLVFANAQQARGLPSEALKLLDEAAAVLAESGEKPQLLAEVLRRIVQIDPERKDASRRLGDMEKVAVTRKKRLMRRLAIAAGVIVLASAAIPFVRGPSASSKIAAARILMESGKATEAAEALAGIDDTALSEDELFDKQAVSTRVEKTLHPSAESTARKEFTSKINLDLGAALDKVVGENVAEGLTAFGAVLDVLDGPEGRRIEALDATAFGQIRTSARTKVQEAIGHASTAAQSVAAKANALRNRFGDEVWRREDLETLHDLIAQCGPVLESAQPARWEAVPGLVQRLVARTEAPKDASDRSTVDAVAVIADAWKEVSQDQSRALARARRKELKEGYKAAYSNGAQLEREGRLDEAIAYYDGFLGKCAELRAAEPEGLYAPIVRELFGGDMQLDQRIRTSRDRLATIVRESDDAQRAEGEDDIETAFRIRRHLVHDHPDIDMTKRFSMPLKIETAPAGAEVFLMDGSPGGRALGRTPLVTSNPVTGGAKFELRLAGYRTYECVRKGALDDAAGVERVDLPKIATWTSKPGGTTEAAPVAAPGAILCASRSGVLRRIDPATGAETARFDPRLLDGFAASPVVRGERVFAASLDGKGFVLDLARLTTLATFETGPVRGAPLVTAAGVFVADETGRAVLLDDSGHVVWSKSVGRLKSDPAAAGGRVLCVTADAELVLVDPGNGEVLRRRQLRTEVVWGPPSVMGNRVFVGNELGELVCFDTSTLEDAWTQQLGGPIRGGVGVSELRVVACTGSGAIHVLDAETGAILSRTLAGGRFDSGPCDLPDGGFVVVTAKGNATRFDAKARPVWKFDAGEDVSAPPRIIGGAVVIVTRKGTIVALEP